ncbi:transcription factor S-II, central domain-containing protein [Cercophora newfieldiana]|uniref:Transcription elongation factor n=1 Tax=Cercophora newfieldiana TaxID=92897 RepID=A0AA39YQ27_9PEZI|nr:transcription factor S-II, central domain-containing protein [Cercophora newfieldiana]
MDDRELTQRIKALAKALTSEPPTTVVKLMEDLKKDTAPTEEQLRSTKAGVTVGRLRSHANRDIARVAGEIVQKWKKNVDAAKDAKKKKEATASPAPAGSSMSKPYEGDTEKRHFKLDKVDTKRTHSDSRNNSIGLLYNGLAYQNRESVEEVVARAVEVEEACFTAFKGETAQYRAKLRTLFTCLKRKDNAKLRQRVLLGEIPAGRFVVMTDKELASDEQRAKDEELQKENMKKAQVPMAEKSISDALKCGKCGQKKVSYSQAQTRSADEPMTTFCECTVCGNRWKVSLLTILRMTSNADNTILSSPERSTLSVLVIFIFITRGATGWVRLVGWRSACMGFYILHFLSSVDRSCRTA